MDTMDNEFAETNDSMQQDRLQVLAAAYRVVFETPQAESVLMDLAEFCHAAKSTFSTDPLEMARREGRREVLMRITDFSELDYRALANLYLKSSWSL